MKKPRILTRRKDSESCGRYDGAADRPPTSHAMTSQQYSCVAYLLEREQLTLLVNNGAQTESVYFSFHTHTHTHIHWLILILPEIHIEGQCHQVLKGSTFFFFFFYFIFLLSRDTKDKVSVTKAAVLLLKQLVDKVAFFIGKAGDFKRIEM